MFVFNLKHTHKSLRRRTFDIVIQFGPTLYRRVKPPKHLQQELKPIGETHLFDPCLKPKTTII